MAVTAQTITARSRRKQVAKSLPKKDVRCTIYGLTDAEGRIRYIGQTRGCVVVRYRFHMKDAFMVGTSAVHKWVAGGGCKGIVVLQENAVWLISEAIWIRECRKIGGKLLNASKEHDDIYRALDHVYAIPEDAEIMALPSA